MKPQSNPYETVKKDISIEYDGDVKVTHIKGYDAKDRVVLLATYRDYPDGTRGHFAKSVESDGYWHGGAYDPIVGMGCQIGPEKFVEGEVK